MNKLEGKLEIFAEQGSGPWLMFEDNKSLGYESLHSFEDGDYLKVYSTDKKQLNLFSEKNICWEGNIDSDKLKLVNQYCFNRSLENKWVQMFREGLEAELTKVERRDG